MAEFPKVDERIELVHQHWIDPDSREIWIHGVDVSGIDYEGTEPGVEYLMATKVIKNLHYLRKQSSRASVTIHLHSGGGDWQEGMAIYDTIKLMPYPVTIISYTRAESMSSIILQAAASRYDTRLILPNSYFMFHYGETSTTGTPNALESELEFRKTQKKCMIDIYTNAVCKSKKFKDKTISQVRRFIIQHMEKRGDVYLTAEETVYWGFADGIIDSWPDHCKWKKSKI